MLPEGTRVQLKLGPEVTGTVLRKASEKDTQDLMHYNMRLIFKKSPWLYLERVVVKWDDGQTSSCKSASLQIINESLISRD